MFTSKERSNLRSLAQSIEPITQVGKSGVGDMLVNTVSEALEKRELVKLTVLENCATSPRDTAEELAESLKAEVVCVTGRKVVLYRKSSRKDVKHIEY